jgi:hypothetical protein
MAYKQSELYGEGGGQAVVAVRPEAVDRLRALAAEGRVPLRRIGTAGGSDLMGVTVTELRRAHENTLPGRLP